MAKKSKEGNQGHNIEQINQMIAEGAKKIIALQAEIDSLHDKKNEIRSALKAAGIPKGSFDRSVRRYQMDPDKRREQDIADGVCNEALGVPAHYEQGDFFQEKEAA